MRKRPILQGAAGGSRAVAFQMLMLIAAGQLTLQRRTKQRTDRGSDTHHQCAPYKNAHRTADDRSTAQLRRERA
jgi:shikimate 5-dehydrogenase